MRRIIDNVRYSFNLWCQIWLSVSDSISDRLEGEHLGGYFN